MTATMLPFILLATEEGLPPSHIAAKIVPLIGAVFFIGSVYILLWSIYGAKKGALVYGTAFFAFGMLIGVFWWFGAPGTPIATGLTYFPGQENDRYLSRWYPMEPGSERAEFFQLTNGLDGLQTPAEYLGLEGASQEQLENDPRYRALIGDLEAAIDRMLAFYLPTNEAGAPVIGSDRRARLREAAGAAVQAGEVPETHGPADPFFTVRAAPREGDESLSAVFVGEERGLRVAAAQLQVVANFVNRDPEAPPEAVEVVVEEDTWYAFEDPGAIWFPSAVWTAVMGAAFAGCLFGLDRVEQREKRAVREREPVDA